MPYKVNSDRNVPWNSLPEMPIDKHLYEDAEITANWVMPKLRYAAYRIGVLSFMTPIQLTLIIVLY